MSAVGHHAVPNTWRWVALRDVCSSIEDGDWIETKDQGGDDYRLLQVSNIGLGVFRETGKFRFVTQPTFERLRCREIRVGDVLVSRMPDPVGRAWCVNRLEWPAITAVDVAIVAPEPSKLDSRFCAYYLNSPVNLAYAAGRASGTTRLRITRRDLAEFPIPIPPIRIQRTVSEALGSFDDLIENNTRRIRILEEMAQAIYREWFVEFRYPGHEDVPLVDSALGPIPDGWKVQPASTVFEVNPRERLAKERLHPFITMGDLNSTGMRCFPSESKAGNSGSKFRNGDTLFARITPCLENGKTGFVACLDEGEVGRGSTEFVVLRGALVGPEFTYLTARSDSFRGNAIKSMSGASGRQRVRNECFGTYMLPTPPNALESRFHETVEPMFRLVFTLSDSNRRLQEARDLLLPRLISGEIDVSGLEVPEVA